MTYCQDKRIMRILRGTKSLAVYITLEGLDWDLLAPPPGYTYEAEIEVRGENNATLSATIANSNTVKFTLNAYEESDIFYNVGMYNMRVKALKKTSQGEIAAQLVFEVDTCIYIYDEILCPPLC